MIVNKNTNVVDEAKEYAQCNRNKDSEYIIYKPLDLWANSEITKQKYEVVHCGGLLDFLIHFFKALWNSQPIFWGNEALKKMSERVTVTIQEQDKEIDQLLPEARLKFNNGEYSIVFGKNEKPLSDMVTTSMVAERLGKVLTGDSIPKPDALTQLVNADLQLDEVVQSKHLSKLRVYRQACKLLNALEKSKDGPSSEYGKALVELNSFLSENWEQLVVQGSQNENRIRDFISSKIKEEIDKAVISHVGKGADLNEDYRKLATLAIFLEETWLPNANGVLATDHKKSKPTIQTDAGDMVTAKDYLYEKMGVTIFERVQAKLQSQTAVADNNETERQAKETVSTHEKLAGAVKDHTEQVEKQLDFAISKLPLKSNNRAFLEQCRTLISKIKDSKILDVSRTQDIVYNSELPKALDLILHQSQSVHSSLVSLQQQSDQLHKKIIAFENQQFEALVKKFNVTREKINALWEEVNKMDPKQLEAELTNMGKQIESLKSKRANLTDINNLNLRAGLIAVAIFVNRQSNETREVDSVIFSLKSVEAYLNDSLRVLSHVSQLEEANGQLEATKKIAERNAEIHKAIWENNAMKEDFFAGKKTLSDLQQLEQLIF